MFEHIQIRINENWKTGINMKIIYQKIKIADKKDKFTAVVGAEVGVW